MSVFLKLDNVEYPVLKLFWNTYTSSFQHLYYQLGARALKSKKYVYLKLYRALDTSIEKVKEDLGKLGNFIKKRAEMNRDLSYITLTMISRRGVYGLVTIAGEDYDTVVKEREIIYGFIESSLESVSAEKIDKVNDKNYLPLPKPDSFFVEEKA